MTTETFLVCDNCQDKVEKDAAIREGWIVTDSYFGTENFCTVGCLVEKFNSRRKDYDLDQIDRVLGKWPKIFTRKILENYDRLNRE